MSYIGFYNNTNPPPNNLKTLLEDLADFKNKPNLVKNILEVSPLPSHIQSMRLDSSIIVDTCKSELVVRVFTLSRLFLYRLGIFIHVGDSVSIVRDGPEGILISEKDYSQTTIERAFALLIDVVGNLYYIGAMRIAVAVTNLCFVLKNELAKAKKIRPFPHQFVNFRKTMLEAYYSKYEVKKKTFFPEADMFRELLDPVVDLPLPVCLHGLIMSHDQNKGNLCLFGVHEKHKNLACKV